MINFSEDYFTIKNTNTGKFWDPENNEWVTIRCTYDVIRCSFLEEYFGSNWFKDACKEIPSEDIPYTIQYTVKIITQITT